MTRTVAPVSAMIAIHSPVIPKIVVTKEHRLKPRGEGHVLADIAHRSPRKPGRPRRATTGSASACTAPRTPFWRSGRRSIWASGYCRSGSSADQGKPDQCPSRLRNGHSPLQSPRDRYLYFSRRRLQPDPNAGTSGQRNNLRGPNQRPYPTSPNTRRTRINSSTTSLAKLLHDEDI